MSEKDLGKAILRVDPATDESSPSADLLRYLLARDKRRASWLTAAVVLIWALVLVFPFGAMSYWADYVRPQHEHLLSITATEHAPGSVARYQSVAIHDLDALFVALMAALVALSLASLATFLLLLLSRQVTLRQVCVNLQALTDQLAQIQRGREKEAVQGQPDA